MEFKFKKEYPEFLKRKEESAKLRAQCPDKIPIICEKDPKCHIQEIDKTKYLVPEDLSISQFCNMLKSRITIDEKESFFLLFKGAHQVGLDSLIQEAYDKYKDEDGFLYVVYSAELVWGKI